MLPCCDFVGNKDHPRACGEKFVANHTAGNMLGSPPRLRGEVLIPPAQFAHIGITPAPAGRSTDADILPDAAEDHPRACGEKGGRCTHDARIIGSPPRLRGEDKKAVKP